MTIVLIASWIAPTICHALMVGSSPSLISSASLRIRRASTASQGDQCPSERRNTRAATIWIPTAAEMCSASGQAENLWMGSRGAYTPDQMVDYWVDERNQFHAGIFPAVSTTGNWVDVGHYTQMIWAGTTAVGCAVHRAPRFDYLICRYSPRGNVDGQRVG